LIPVFNGILNCQGFNAFSVNKDRKKL